MQAMMKPIGMRCAVGWIVILLMARAAMAAVPVAIQGKVYLDANGNGLAEANEAGLAGIRMTDGVQFVTTAADGSYSLTVTDDYMIPCRAARTVSVCWPSGKWPSGRWWRRLSEITDPADVSFALRDDVQTLPFVFLQASDDHGSGKMYGEHYVHDARLMKPAAKFIFNTGDMGYATPEGADAMFRSIAGEVAAFPLPMWCTPGNHDFVGAHDNAPMDQPHLGWGRYTQYLGPVRWSFDYAGVHFIGLDYMEKTDKGYRDQIPRVAVEFMENDLASLAKGTRVVMLVHCYDAHPSFYQALRKHKVEQICSGHTHTPTYARVGKVPTMTNYGLATGVVTETSIDIAERRPLTFGNSSLLAYFKQVTAPAMEKRRRQHHAVSNKQLAATSFTINGSPQAESAEIQLEMLPGGAKMAGLRVGTKEVVEIAFDGTAVHVAGVSMPLAWTPHELTFPPAPGAPANTPARKIPADGVLRWHLLIDRDRLSILGNNLFRMTKAVRVDHPAVITLFAAGGDATFKQVNAWELHPVTHQGSRGLHHFAPPSWTWGVPQLIAACVDPSSPDGREMLQRFSPDGVKDYDIE